MLLFPIIYASLFGILESRQANINPKSVLSNDDTAAKSFLDLRTNDDHSSWFHRPISNQKKLYTFHKPREDPRLFYQSQTYLEENNGQNFNNEVSFIYPGREVVRADEVEDWHQSLPIRVQDKPSIHQGKICVKCPTDRTLVAQADSDRILLTTPQLLACSGTRTPRTVRFIQMYGPKFGTAVGRGTYTITGRITYKKKTVQICTMKIHVMVNACNTPKHLISNCDPDDRNRTCSFTCRNPKMELRGQHALICGNDSKWIGELPVCRVRTWCQPPIPPEHGSVGCNGLTVGTQGLRSGSKCRAKCPHGWRPGPASICRRGTWNHELSCHLK